MLANGENNFLSRPHRKVGGTFFRTGPDEVGILIVPGGKVEIPQSAGREYPKH